jgi:hypothetical protein
MGPGFAAQNICYLDLGEGKAGEAWANSCGGCGAVGQGWGSQEECMASRREILIEILDYLASEQWAAGRRCSYSSWALVSKNVSELELQYAHFCLNKLAFAFLTDCVYWFLTSLSMLRMLWINMFQFLTISIN